MSIKRAAAATIAAAAAITLAIAIAPSADAIAGAKLLRTADYQIPCRWGRDGSDVRMETVDFAFRANNTVYLQATDGVQFIAVRTSQNLPYSCAPIVKRQTPASWANS